VKDLPSSPESGIDPIVMQRIKQITESKDKNALFDEPEMEFFLGAPITKEAQAQFAYHDVAKRAHSMWIAEEDSDEPLKEKVEVLKDKLEKLGIDTPLAHLILQEYNDVFVRRIAKEIGGEGHNKPEYWQIHFEGNEEKELGN
jgi:hypothetical protein